MDASVLLPSAVPNGLRTVVVERPSRRIDHQLYLGFLRDPRALLREGNGAIEAAQLVDQADLLRLTAGPHASLTDGQNHQRSPSFAAFSTNIS